MRMPQGPQMPAMPLSMAHAGDTVTVSRVKGAADVKRHLETLGFVEGSQVHVVTSGGVTSSFSSKALALAWMPKWPRT